MTDHHRDIDRGSLMNIGEDHMTTSNMTPLLFHGVDNGNPGTGMSTSNIGCLFVDLRILGGKHVASYRLGWITDEGQDELELGDAVEYELAVAMYQAMLQLITNNHPEHSDIKRFLLGQEI